MIRVVIALLTFSIGLVSARLVADGGCDRRFIKVQATSAPELKPDSQPITFSSDGIITAFQPHYSSSDGGHLRSGCFEYESSSKAAKGLREEIKGNPIIERGSKLNERGEQIGERVVVTGETASGTEVRIVWTEGARVFSIQAPSVKHVLLFEASRIWAHNDFCVTVAPMRRKIR